MLNVPAIRSLLQRASTASQPSTTSFQWVSLFLDTTALLAQLDEQHQQQQRWSAEDLREANQLVALLCRLCESKEVVGAVASACVFAGGMENERGERKASSDLYSIATAFLSAVRIASFVNKAQSLIPILDKSLRIFDPKGDWRALLFDAPDTPGEDTDDILGMEVPRGTQVSSKKAGEVASVARFGQALSGAMFAAGNARQALHVILCSINIYERIRACAAVPAEARIGEQELRELYYNATEESMRLGEPDLAVELGSKLVTIYEVAIAEALMETRDEATSVSVVPHGHVDPFGHFKAQEQLGRALGRFGDADGSFNAHRRALELLEVEWPFAEENTTKSFVAPAYIRKSLYSNMMTCSRLLDHPIHESLGHARNAVAVLREMDHAEETTHANPSDARMLLAAGTITYLYALELAGGVQFASSPPVAALRMERKGVPEIMDLLDEAGGYLEDALSRAELGNVEGGKSCIALQLAVLRVERRQESRARSLLSMFHITRELLTDLDTIRRLLSNPPSPSTPPPHIPPAMQAFVETVYSPAVFARLLPLARESRPNGTPSPPPSLISASSRGASPEMGGGSSPNSVSGSTTASGSGTPKSSSSSTTLGNVFSFVTLTRKLTLSRTRAPSVVRITCDVCCMTSQGGVGGNGEPTRCEVCVESGGKVVHFCDEECLAVHLGKCHPGVGGTLSRGGGVGAGFVVPERGEHRRGVSVGGWR